LSSAALASPIDLRTSEISMSNKNPIAHSDDASERVLLERESPVPLYLQIKEHLVRDIAAAGARRDKFYTDSELCAKFRVSRMTVRQAVQELVNDGLVKRARGIGTFIVTRRGGEGAASCEDFRARWEAEGRPMAVELLSYETRPCPPGFAEDLAIAANAPVRFVFRLRSAGAMPIALDYRYLPVDVAAGISQADAGSLLSALRGRFELAHKEAHLEATSAGEAEMRWLDVPRGAPLMMRRMRVVSKDRQPVLAGYTVYRADLVRYAVHMPLAGIVLGPPARAEDQDRLVRLRREVAAPVQGF
jgi:GntR family transcriptional regulator